VVLRLLAAPPGAAVVAGPAPELTHERADLRAAEKRVARAELGTVRIQLLPIHTDV
jgi:hypothetical protein